MSFLCIAFRLNFRAGTAPGKGRRSLAQNSLFLLFYELNEVEPLCYPAQIEVVFVPVPEPSQQTYRRLWWQIKDPSMYGSAT